MLITLMRNTWKRLMCRWWQRALECVEKWNLVKACGTGACGTGQCHRFCFSNINTSCGSLGGGRRLRNWFA